MRMQLAPLPLNMPATPSVRQMCDRPLHTPLYAVVVLPATCWRIFRRSRGATAVRETPPAMPPARALADGQHPGAVLRHRGRGAGSRERSLPRRGTLRRPRGRRRARRARTGDRRGRERLARRRGRHLAPYAIRSRCRTVPPEVRVWRERRSRRTEHRDGASTTANNEFIKILIFLGLRRWRWIRTHPLSSFCECRGCHMRISLKLLRKAVVATWRKIRVGVPSARAGYRGTRACAVESPSSRTSTPIRL